MDERQRSIMPFAADGAGITVTMIFVAVVSLFVVLATQFPQLYILATYEDLPGEWTQAFFFMATLVLSLLLARRIHPYRLFFLFLALCCFYVLGEEISWGQRLFSFASPEFFQRHNLQQEVNLHNFFTGPTATLQKRIIEIGLVAGLLGYGLLYPLLMKSSNRLAQWLATHGLPVPPLYLSPYFVAAALCEVRLFSFNEAEVAELLVAMAMTFMTLHYLFEKQGGHKCSSSVKVATMTGVVVVCLLGAGGVSWYCWTSPELHEQMTQRITAGQKKFAKRYCRFEDWQNATALYESLLLKKPKDRDLLRSLAQCYKEVGDEKRFLVTNSKAILLDMMQYGRNPRQVAVNLSLFQSFQQNGNKEKAQQHLTKAMKESLDKVQLEPDNASSFYWYGKSLLAQGNANAAIWQFARAVSMKPTSKKYQQAYREILRTSEKS